MLYNNITKNNVVSLSMARFKLNNQHDHQVCIDKALQQAEELCLSRGVRLTLLRKRVLFIIWQSHKPLGAYDILNILTTEDGRNAAPPTVYRALDFLLDNQLIHRLASCNAFVGCSHPMHTHEGYFLICNQCNNVIEIEHTDINRAIEVAAQKVDFSVTNQTVEVLGLCSDCQKSHQIHE